MGFQWLEHRTIQRLKVVRCVPWHWKQNYVILYYVFQYFNRIAMSRMAIQQQKNFSCRFPWDEVCFQPFQKYGWSYVCRFLRHKNLRSRRHSVLKLSLFIFTLRDASRWQKCTFSTTTGCNSYCLSFFSRCNCGYSFGPILSKYMSRTVIQLESCFVHIEDRH